MAFQGLTLCSQNLKIIGQEAICEIFQFDILGLWLPVDQDLIWDMIFTALSVAISWDSFLIKKQTQVHF